jgi:hypothetical protein
MVDKKPKPKPKQKSKFNKRNLKSPPLKKRNVPPKRKAPTYKKKYVSPPPFRYVPSSSSSQKSPVRKTYPSPPPPMYKRSTSSDRIRIKEEDAYLKREYLRKKQRNSQYNDYNDYNDYNEYNKQKQGQSSSQSNSNTPRNLIDHYKYFGLTIDATKSDVVKAWKKLSLKYHPDKNVNKPNQDYYKRKIQRINNTYQIIMNVIE